MVVRTLLRNTLSPLVAGAVAGLACFVSEPRTAGAQQVYVYAEPPPPPRARYVYERGPEPPYQFMLGVDVEGVIPMNMPALSDGNTFQGGGGFKVRIGERIRLQHAVHLTPEVGYAYDHLFTADDQGDAYAWDMHRLFAGARLSFGTLVVPSIYAHVGYGWRDTGDPTVTSADGGLAYDVGGALDFRFIRHLAVGAHIEYAGLNLTTDSPQWLALGAHAEITF